MYGQRGRVVVLLLAPWITWDIWQVVGSLEKQMQNEKELIRLAAKPCPRAAAPVVPPLRAPRPLLAL